MIFIDNKYTKYYYLIIDNAKSRINKPKTYLENHHIIPESFFINRTRTGPAGWVQGNPEDKSNKVKLTAHEHYVCHLLLVRMTEGKGRMKMANALNRIATKNKKDNKVKITGRMYAMIRQELSRANSGEGNQMFGKTGELAPCYGRTGDKHPMFGKTVSEESNKARSEKLSGVPKSVESNKKRSDSHTGKKHDYQLGDKNQCHTQLRNGRHPSQIKISCLCCKITCSSNMFSRYHGDNCKLKLHSIAV